MALPERKSAVIVHAILLLGNTFPGAAPVIDKLRRNPDRTWFKTSRRFSGPVLRDALDQHRCEVVLLLRTVRKDQDGIVKAFDDLIRRQAARAAHGIFQPLLSKFFLS